MNRAIVLLLLCLLAIPSCKKFTKESPTPVAGISVNPQTARMFVGQNASIVAYVFPTDAANKALTWSSSNLEVATISESGSISALGSGTSTIKATTPDGKSAECALIVEAKGVPVTGISLDKTTLTLSSLGVQETITPIVMPTDATYKNIFWYSSNSTVATVSNGVVTAKGKGASLIIATTEEGAKTASCNVFVSF